MFGEIFNWEKIQSFCEGVCYFVGVNVMFLLANLPLWLFFMFIGISRAGTYIFLFFLCLLPMAPALTAVFYAMNKLLQQEDHGGIRGFCKGYAKNFLPACKAGLVHVAVLFLTWTNLVFFKNTLQILPVYLISVILFLMAVLITPTLYLLVSRYEMKTLEIIKAAVILEIGRPVFTLGNAAALGIVLMAFEIAPGPAVVFMGSVYGFLVVFMNKRMLQKFES